MSSCNADKLVQAAKDSLEILNSKSELTDNNYKVFKEARKKPLDKIIVCHQEKMKVIETTADSHANNNTELHSFEKKIAELLIDEKKLRYDKDKIEAEEHKFSKLLEEKYKLDSKIEEYERKTNKITENMTSNDTLLESQTTKTMLLKNINIGVLIFVIISLLYINFKPFVTRKSKMMQLKKKEDNLFSSKNDKKMTENVNNENKMM